MRISQKLEYACRALAQLAKNFDGKTITRLEEIAQREAVSANFLVQILNDLRKSGIITSKRGKMGGYILSKPPRTITLYEIVEAIEPALTDKSISTDGESGDKVCNVWKNISGSFASELRVVTLDQLVADAAEDMFYI